MTTFVHVTDLHFGCEDKGAHAAVARYVRETKPDAVIVTGDISKDGLQHELDAACDWMRALPAPVMLTPGNHDVPYYNPIGRIFYPWARYKRAARGLRTDVWETERWTIIPINTARGIQLRLNWAQGAISGRQVAKAAQILRRAPDDALRVIISHHPLDWPQEAPIHGATLGGSLAIEQLIEAGADLFLSGHLHRASSRQVGVNSLSVGSGTLSQRQRGEPASFSVIRHIAPESLQVEVMHVMEDRVESATKITFQITHRHFIDATRSGP